MYVMATHGIFSGNSVDIVKDNSDFIQKIVVSNTVPQAANLACLPHHLHVLDVSGKLDKGEFSIEPWYALVKIAPSVYQSVQVY